MDCVRGTNFQYKLKRLCAMFIRCYGHRLVMSYESYLNMRLEVEKLMNSPQAQILKSDKLWLWQDYPTTNKTETATAERTLVHQFPGNLRIISARKVWSARRLMLYSHRPRLQRQACFHQEPSPKGTTERWRNLHKRRRRVRTDPWVAASGWSRTRRGLGYPELPTRQVSPPVSPSTPATRRQFRRFQQQRIRRSPEMQ